MKLLERCIPPDKAAAKRLVEKELRVQGILAEHTRLLTSTDWILAERIKHCHQTTPPDAPERSLTPELTPNVSSADLSAQLAAAPKEEEVWATDCAVCLSEFTKDENVRELLPCEHIFHDECIHNWFMKAAAAACPLCRHVLRPPTPDQSVLQPQPGDHSLIVPLSATPPVLADPSVVPPVGTV